MKAPATGRHRRRRRLAVPLARVDWMKEGLDVQVAHSFELAVPLARVDWMKAYGWSCGEAERNACSTLGSGRLDESRIFLMHGWMWVTLAVPLARVDWMKALERRGEPGTVRLAVPLARVDWMKA